MANDTGFKAPVVVNPCPSIYNFHTCMHEAGHTQDHACKHGCWRNEKAEEKPDVK